MLKELSKAKKAKTGTIYYKDSSGYESSINDLSFVSVLEEKVRQGKMVEIKFKGRTK